MNELTPEMRKPPAGIVPQPPTDQDLEKIRNYKITKSEEQLIFDQTRQTKYQWMKQLLRRLLKTVLGARQCCSEGQLYYLIFSEVGKELELQRKATTRGMTQRTAVNRRSEINKALQGVGIPGNVAEASLFPRAVYEQINDDKEEAQERQSQFFYTVSEAEALINKARELLDSEKGSEIFAGLGLLIGRRNGELLSGGFAKASSHSIYVWNLSKTPNNICIEIPTLCESEKVISCIKRLRSLYENEVEMILSKHDSVNSTGFKAELNPIFKGASDAAREHFSPLLKVWQPTDSSENSKIYAHLFRGLYASIAQLYFYPGGVNEVNYRSYIQGHFGRNGTGIAMTSRNNYDRFFCSDRTEGAKGLKLEEWGVEPLDVQSLMAGVRENDGFPQAWPYPDMVINPPEKDEPNKSDRADAQDSPLGTEVGDRDIEQESEAVTAPQSDRASEVRDLAMAPEQEAVTTEVGDRALELDSASVTDAGDCAFSLEQEALTTEVGDRGIEPDRATDIEAELTAVKERLGVLEDLVMQGNYHQNGVSAMNGTVTKSKEPAEVGQKLKRLSQEVELAWEREAARDAEIMDLKNQIKQKDLEIKRLKLKLVMSDPQSMTDRELTPEVRCQLSEKEFQREVLGLFEKLDKSYNYGGLVPIWHLRQEIGSRVSREDFNKYLMEMQAQKLFYLQSGEHRDATDEQKMHSITSEVRGLLFYASDPGSLVNESNEKRSQHSQTEPNKLVKEIEVPVSLALGRRSKAAQETYFTMLNDVVNAIQSHNQQERSRYFISQSSVMKFLRCKGISAPQKVISAYFEMFDNEIKAHNRTFQISQKSSTSPETLPIEIQWVEVSG